MSLTDVQILELKIELTTDPAALGYDGTSNAQAADILNLVRDTITVDRRYISNEELLTAVIGTEFMALGAAEQRGWLAVMSLDQVPVANANIRGQILAIWGAGTATRTNLAALQTQDGSRAEQIWWQGIGVSHAEVSKARAI
ncbi:MAG: hypothetical protein ACXAEN_14880 [Candidatus Thorarchaeota archaeon]|jgi:hypothetical protein